MSNYYVFIHIIRVGILIGKELLCQGSLYRFEPVSTRFILFNSIKYQIIGKVAIGKASPLLKGVL